MLHQLNQLELQNIRHLIGAHCTIEKKLNEYASFLFNTITEFN